MTHGYHVVPDDRGWPMAHAVLPDGTSSREPVGSMIGLQTKRLAAVVHGVAIVHAEVIVAWFEFGRDEHWAGEWEIRLNAAQRAMLSPVGHELFVDLEERPAMAAWCGPERICGRRPFPFTYAEWSALPG